MVLREATSSPIEIVLREATSSPIEIVFREATSSPIEIVLREVKEANNIINKMYSMYGLHKNLDLIVYHFIHRDIMKQLNSEYHKKVRTCSDLSLYECKGGVCNHFIKVIFIENLKTCWWDTSYAYNYRKLHDITYFYERVYDKCNSIIGKIPKNY